MWSKYIYELKKIALLVSLTIICTYFVIFTYQDYTIQDGRSYSQNGVAIQVPAKKNLKILWEIFLIAGTALATSICLINKFRQITRDEIDKDLRIEELVSCLESERAKSQDRELEIGLGADGAEKFNQLMDGLWHRVQGELSEIAHASDAFCEKTKSGKEVFDIIENTGIMKLRLGILSPSIKEQIDIQQVIDDVLLMLYQTTLKQNIEISIEKNFSFYFETDRILVEYMFFCIFLRIIAGFGEKKKIKISFGQSISGLCDVFIEDDGFEIDFFNFKVDTMFNANISSIKLLARQLGCIIRYERFKEHNVTKISIPETIRLGRGNDTKKMNIVDLETYRKNKA